ncbi:MAG: STAS domain-containing protein [Pseudomonadota bacterium]
MSDVISLDGRLDLAATEKLVEALNAAKGGSVTIDAANATLLGGQCLQVLLSAAAQWRADGHDFVVQNPSTAFQENLSMLGVSSDLFPLTEAAS